MRLNSRKNKISPSVVARFCIVAGTLLIIELALSGCVSVKIGAESAKKSSGVSYEAPPSPFVSMSNEAADQAWQNKTNGNSISFLSTCNDPSDPTLDQSLRDLVANLKDPLVHQSPTTVEGREALDCVAEGTVEGVRTELHAVLFKKNGCLYTISLVGLKKHFVDDAKAFAAFVDGFRAP